MFLLLSDRLTPSSLLPCSVQPLVRVRCLCVNIQRDPTVRVSQEFLNGFDILSIQQCAEGMPESVPSDFLVNANCFRNWLDMPLHEVVRPIGLISLRFGSFECGCFSRKCLNGTDYCLPTFAGFIKGGFS